MTSSEEIRKAIAVLRYHNRLKIINDPDYVGSTFEADTLDSISSLDELHKRMTESNRSDFIGEGI